MFFRKSLGISIILIAFDVFAIYIIFHVATTLRQPIIGRQIAWKVVAPLANLGVIIIIITFIFQQLYPGYGLTAVKELKSIGNAVTLAFFLLAAISFLVKSFHIFPRSILLIGWGISFITLPLLHFILRNILSRSSWYGVPVLILGDFPYANEVADTLRRVRRLGWRPQRIIPLQEFMLNNGNDTTEQVALLAVETKSSVENLTRHLVMRFRTVILVEKTSNFGSLWIEPRDLDGRLGLEFHYHLLEKHNQGVKRIFDLAGAALLLILFSPVLLILSLLIVIDSPGGIFFRQDRLGQNLEQIKVIKFRTMVKGAEKKLDQLLQANPDLRREYETYHKLDKDPRVTRVGSVLRKFSLDELPQLWNVLIGEMSLVGPRAYMPSELKDIGSYKDIIFPIKPGMTGWWQIMGRHRTTFQNRLQMDEYYISNWSLWMDIYILLKTVWVVFQGGGA